MEIVPKQHRLLLEQKVHLWKLTDGTPLLRTASTQVTEQQRDWASACMNPSPPDVLVSLAWEGTPQAMHRETGTPIQSETLHLQSFLPTRCAAALIDTVLVGVANQCLLEPEAYATRGRPYPTLSEWPGNWDWIAQGQRVGPTKTGLNKGTKSMKWFPIILFYPHRSDLVQTTLERLPLAAVGSRCRGLQPVYEESLSIRGLYRVTRLRHWRTPWKRRKDCTCQRNGGHQENIPSHPHPSPQSNKLGSYALTETKMASVGLRGSAPGPLHICYGCLAW